MPRTPVEVRGGGGGWGDCSERLREFAYTCSADVYFQIIHNVFYVYLYLNFLKLYTLWKKNEFFLLNGKKLFLFEDFFILKVSGLSFHSFSVGYSIGVGFLFCDFVYKDKKET